MLVFYVARSANMLLNASGAAKYVNGAAQEVSIVRSLAAIYGAVLMIARIMLQSHSN